MAAKTSQGETERSGRSIDEQRLREDRALFERFADERDPVDREMLVERFLPLARSLAQRYVRAGEAFDDVFQVACVGLINAIDRFELDRGVDLAAYAIPSIVGEIKRHLRDRVGPIRIPRRLQEVSASLNAGAAGLGAKLQRPASAGNSC